jgi:hypothetical protein
MYQFSRAIYRELSLKIAAQDASSARDAHACVLHACEETIERLAKDPHYFARPERALFGEVRRFFPMGEQARVYKVIEAYLVCAREILARQANGYDAHGNPLQCRATTRRGTPCQRAPLSDNGYCPSHQHLAETEHGHELTLAA